jgi:hypothetical protein
LKNYNALFLFVKHFLEISEKSPKTSDDADEGTMAKIRNASSRLPPGTACL